MSGFFIPLLWRGARRVGWQLLWKACPDESGGTRRRVGWQFKTMITSITITKTKSFFKH